MNWRWSKLDNLTLLSNSDGHSPRSIGREANVFDTDLSYSAISDAIKEKKIVETIEFFPEEGKYHYDGHRNCGVLMNPEESRKNNYICPKCGKPLTIGTLSRIEELSDRKNGEKPENAAGFRYAIPLEEIIAEAKGMTVGAKAVGREYKNIIKEIGSEFKVLLSASRDHIERVASFEIAEAIERVRNKKVDIIPGYDGEYGKISIFKDEERRSLSRQTSLF